MRPFETSPRLCPARPTRCSPRATDFGLSTWITRSTAPMSMPSSSDEVATRHGIRPAFSSSSISVRCSRASEPWWARAIVSLRELVEPQREPLGEPAVVDEDDRGAVLPHEVEQAPGRSTARSSACSTRSRTPSRRRPAAPAGRDRGRSPARACPRARRSPRGRAPCGSRRRRARSAGRPATNRPISSSGRCVAESPMRWNGLSVARSSRSSDSARCAPRFVPATACTSSMITVSIPRRVSRACEVSRR